MVSGGSAGARRNSFPPSQGIQERSRGRSRLFALANRNPEVCFDCGRSARSLARLQRGRLPESTRVRQRPLLGESHRAENRNRESGEGESVGGGIVLP